MLKRANVYLAISIKAKKFIFLAIFGHQASHGHGLGWICRLQTTAKMLVFVILTSLNSYLKIDIGKKSVPSPSLNTVMDPSADLVIT